MPCILPLDVNIFYSPGTFGAIIYFEVAEPFSSALCSLSISLSNCTSFLIFSILSITKPCSISTVYPNPNRFSIKPQKKNAPRNWIQYEKTLKMTDVTCAVMDGPLFSEAIWEIGNVGSLLSSDDKLLVSSPPSSFSLEAIRVGRLTGNCLPVKWWIPCCWRLTSCKVFETIVA